VPPFDLGKLATMGSLFVTRPTLVHYMSDRSELLGRANALFDWIASGQLKLRIDKSFALADAAEAHRQLEGRKTTGKVVLVP
jgi:NADPH2:quinone reductase